MRKVIIAGILFCVMICAINLYAMQSTITEAEGYACSGDDKSRKQTEQDALLEVKRLAVENAIFYIKSETTVKDFVVDKDIVQAYSNATVKVMEFLDRKWYKDERSGDCYKIKIKAEIIPDEKAMKEISAKKEFSDDPTLPLTVKVWTEKNQYKEKENIKIFLKGNKPFFARVLYINAKGESLQILPNPYRTDNYFHGGVIYEIPSGNDRFDLEVSPPYGDENIVVYASSSELGNIKLKPAGAVYEVKTKPDNVGVSTRGIKLKETVAGSRPAESFYEDKITIKTSK
jgi:hypothetical protein